jgi:hypothetical protein
MPLSVKHGGVHKDGEVWIKHSSSWKRGELWVRQDGVWKLGAAVLTYTPPPGNYSASGNYTVEYTVSASEAVTWTFSLPVNVAASVTSGTSSTSVTFYLNAEPPADLENGVYTTRVRTVNLTATSNGQSSTFNINLTALGD